MSEEPKSDGTFFKEEIERIIMTRYKEMTVYETIGALEAVKFNLMERLGRITEDDRDDT